MNRVFLTADSFSFAENTEQVPEPSHLYLEGLALFFAIRKHNFFAYYHDDFGESELLSKGSNLLEPSKLNI